MYMYSAFYLLLILHMCLHTPVSNLCPLHMCLHKPVSTRAPTYVSAHTYVYLVPLHMYLHTPMSNLSSSNVGHPDGDHW